MVEAKPTLLQFCQENNIRDSLVAGASAERKNVRLLTTKIPRGTPEGSWWWRRGGGGRQPVLQILTLLQTKTCNFPHLFSDQTSKIYTRFQTWPLGRNYAFHYLDRKQNNSSNSFRMRIFLFLTYSFGIKTINTCSCKYVHALP